LAFATYRNGPYDQGSKRLHSPEGEKRLAIGFYPVVVNPPVFLPILEDLVDALQTSISPGIHIRFEVSIIVVYT
jgi:hypothetical protein